MSPTLIYIHGQYGSPEEAEHYRPLLPGCEVIGLDYKAQTPWEAEREFAEYFDGLGCAIGGISAADQNRDSSCDPSSGIDRKCSSIGIIANSIGAFYAMCTLSGRSIAAAYFISPIVDLERIEGVTLDEEHLRYVRQHPIDWRVPTHILYGENDRLTSLATIADFARRTGATLEVMPGGEHWFHTPQQMAFLNGWIQRAMLR